MIEIVPAIDLIDGKCVRLTQGDFNRKTEYSADPVETARAFEGAGLKRLHMVDLDGARTGFPANLNVLERVAAATSLMIDFGGGIKTNASLEAAFSSGAAIVNIGSLAVKGEETFLGWIEQYGGGRFLLGADSSQGCIAIDGWKTTTDIPLDGFVRKYVEKGVRSIFVTDVASDGAMTGPAFCVYTQLLNEIHGLELIASGGVRNIEDVDQLDALGCSGVIIGKAIYEGKISLKEVARYAR